MARYRLDDLGWFQFERLVQSLLKARVGMSVEAWGGHSDLGRDAYTAQPLAYPSPPAIDPGPFLFQAKFVAGANAAGAKWRPALLAAVDAECVRIASRQLSNTWGAPRHYVLFTNCPVTATARKECSDRISAAVPGCVASVQGGLDVESLLDNLPALRRSFPEILGLRDIDALLRESVSGHILRRSKAAVEESRDLIPVFVPTQAYYDSIHALSNHNFVVLDGPPEMGKTAIARTIAFGKLISGCEVVECRNPDDLFQAFDFDGQQLFVADDAFGRTEYDPALGRAWEGDLPKVLYKLDNKHQLVWTSRRHILLRAMKEMDLTGRASSFPRPGEVVVAADRLTVEEKSRILYRHCKRAQLSAQQVATVKRHARLIVESPHFTPERIRRLAVEVLPGLPCEDGPGALASGIRDEVMDAIQRPTDRMRKALRRLPQPHLSLLTLLLDSQDQSSSLALRGRFAKIGGRLLSAAFDDVLDDLRGTFLRVADSGGEADRVQWIHPSYRDLIIDEIGGSQEMQVAFIRNATIHGLKLALSTGGGSEGKRMLPMLGCAEAWEALEGRCASLVREEGGEVLWSLIMAVVGVRMDPEVGEESKGNIQRLRLQLAMYGSQQYDGWQSGGSVQHLELLMSLSSGVDGAELPDPGAIWERYSADVECVIEADGDNAVCVEYWASLVDVINERYPEFSRSEAFKQRRSQIEAALFALADVKANIDIEIEDWATNQERGSNLKSLADGLSKLSSGESREALVDQLASVAELYLEHGRDGADYDGDDDYRPQREGFEIDVFFADL